MQARTTFWQAKFLIGLRKCANITQACEEAGIDRATAYKARERDPEFRLRWDQTVEAAIDDLESEAWRRATEGVTRNEPVMYQGEQVATKVITEHSDKLMELLLKANRPNKYREQIKIVTERELDETINRAIQEHSLPAPIDTTATVTDVTQ